MELRDAVAAKLKEVTPDKVDQYELLLMDHRSVRKLADEILLAAVGVDGNGDKHPLGVMEGASDNAAVGQALIDNLVGRGASTPSSAALKAIRASLGRNTPIQRCQVHKARNIIERLPQSLHASVRRALRQALELDDADKAEKLIRNLARRLGSEAPGVSASVLEGLDEILTVTRLRLPIQLRRSLACTNIIENMKRLQAQGLPECEAPARRRYGHALDGRRHDRGRQELLTPESPQTFAEPARRAARVSGAARRWRLALTTSARLHSLINQRRPPSLFQHRAGHPLPSRLSR